MEKREMQQHLKTLESFATDFADARSKQRRSNQQTRRQGDSDYDTAVKVARAYLERNPELHELLVDDENVNAADEFFLDGAKYFDTDLQRALPKLRELIATTEEEIPIEQAAPNE
jgi:hypothetical protein